MLAAVFLLAAFVVAGNTEPGASPWLALIVWLLLGSGAYWLGCQIWPYAACRACDGSGRHPSPNGRAWRPCSRCAGTGGRRRWFARDRDGGPTRP